jgi:hypothetical protein
MSETRETKTARKDIVIAFGIICIILVAGLGGTIAVYTSMINDKNNTISSLDTQISELKSNVTYLEEQLDSVLNGSSHLLGIITGDPSAWVNRTAQVEGNISSFLPAGFWWPPYNYELSSNGTMIGVSWQGEYSLYNGKNVMVLGIVTEGRWNEMLANGTVTTYGPVIYFIEAERVDIL